MSYLSREEIVHTAMAKHFLSAAGYDHPGYASTTACIGTGHPNKQYDYDEVLGMLRDVFRELADVIYESDNIKPGWHVWHRLMDIARNEIKAGEQAYFESKGGEG